jgi:hypothetical protein
MSPEFLIGQAVMWTVVIVVCMLVMRRSDARFQERLAEFSENETRWQANLRRVLDDMDRRAGERAEASRRRLDQLLAEAEALAHDPHAGDEPDSPPRPVTISVTMPADTPPREVDAVVQTLRAATGHRFPIHIDAPVRTG